MSREKFDKQIIKKIIDMSPVDNDLLSNVKEEDLNDHVCEVRLRDEMQNVFRHGIARFLTDDDAVACMARWRALAPLLALAFRPDMRRRNQGVRDYDYPALFDFHNVALLSCSLLALGHQEALDLCIATSYGRYLGLQKVNTLQGIYMRSVRALLLDDSGWSAEELRSVETTKISRDFMEPAFNARTRYWTDMLCSLSAGDGAGFTRGIDNYCMWYTGMVKRSFTTDGGYSMFIFPNYVAMLLQKIAFIKGIILELRQDEFADPLLVNLGP